MSTRGGIQFINSLLYYMENRYIGMNCTTLRIDKLNSNASEMGYFSQCSFNSPNTNEQTNIHQMNSWSNILNCKGINENNKLIIVPEYEILTSFHFKYIYPNYERQIINKLKKITGSPSDGKELHQLLNDVSTPVFNFLLGSKEWIGLALLFSYILSERQNHRYDGYISTLPTLEYYENNIKNCIFKASHCTIVNHGSNNQCNPSKYPSEFYYMPKCIDSLPYLALTSSLYDQISDGKSKYKIMTMEELIKNYVRLIRDEILAVYNYLFLSDTSESISHESLLVPSPNKFITACHHVLSRSELIPTPAYYSSMGINTEKTLGVIPFMDLMNHSFTPNIMTTFEHISINEKLSLRDYFPVWYADMLMRNPNKNHVFNSQYSIITGQWSLLHNPFYCSHESMIYFYSCCVGRAFIKSGDEIHRLYPSHRQCKLNGAKLERQDDTQLHKYQNYPNYQHSKSINYAFLPLAEDQSALLSCEDIVNYQDAVFINNYIYFILRYNFLI